MIQVFRIQMMWIDPNDIAGNPPRRSLPNSLFALPAKVANLSTVTITQSVKDGSVYAGNNTGFTLECNGRLDVAHLGHDLVDIFAHLNHKLTQIHIKEPQNRIGQHRQYRSL
eukprot:1093334_1